jgi:hypothetical protein
VELVRAAALVVSQGHPAAELLGQAARGLGERQVARELGEALHGLQKGRVALVDCD